MTMIIEHIEHYESKQKIVTVTACLFSKQDVEKLISALAILKQFLPCRGKHEASGVLVHEQG
jgi:hypothetical protein